MTGTSGMDTSTGHQQADLLTLDVGADDVDDAAVVHHRDPVGEGEHLVELGGDDDHGGALVALLDDPLVGPVALLGGGLGYGRYGAAGLGPAGLLLVILVVLALAGRL